MPCGIFARMNDSSQIILIIVLALLLLVWLPVAIVVWARAIRQDRRERKKMKKLTIDKAYGTKRKSSV